MSKIKDFLYIPKIHVTTVTVILFTQGFGF